MASLPFSFKFAHINLGHTRAALDQLVHDIVANDYDLISINEPYVIQNVMPVLIEGYCVINFSVDPKVGFIVKSIYEPFIVKCYSEHILISLTFEKKAYYFYTIYCSPGEDLEDLLYKIDELYSMYSMNPFMFLGDFNAKSTIWGNYKNDARGNKLVEFINLHSLTVCNDPNSPPTYSSSIGVSWIDLVIVNDFMSADVEVTVLDTISNSDHNLLHCEFNIQTATNFVNRKIDIKNVNWMPTLSNLRGWFRENDIEDYDVNDQVKLNDFVERAQDGILNCIAYVDRPKNRRRRKSAYWWNEKLTIERSRVRALRRRFQAITDDDEMRERYRLEYRRAFAKYKRNLTITKRQSFKDYIQSIVNIDGMKKEYRIISDKIRRPWAFVPVRKGDGSYTESVAEAKAFIHGYHFPYSNLGNMWYKHDYGGDYFDICEIGSVVSELKNGKSPGHEGIINDILKACFKVNQSWFLKLMNFCLKLGCFPRVWKAAEIVLIPKEGKDPSLPGSYRPICLLPCMGKILDKLICSRLVVYLERNGLISSNQFGFRKNISAIDALSSINQFVKESTSLKMMTSIISVDIKNAFNSVNWQRIRALLDSYEVPHDLKNVINSFIDDRSYYNGEEALPYDKGIPQSSSIGPILWVLIINDLLKENLGDDAKIQAYADDIVIMTRARHPYLFEYINNRVLNIVWNWCNNNNLEINFEKSNFLIVSVGRNVSRIPPVRVGGTSIKYCNNMKYLGVVLDDKWSGLSHLERLQEKIGDFQNRMMRITRATWGISPHILKQLYLTVTQKIIKYGAEIWYRDNVRTNLRLIKIQRIALISITKCYRTVSSDTMSVLAGIPPIDIEIRQEINLWKILKESVDIEVNGTVYSKSDFENVDFYWEKPYGNSISWSWYDGSDAGVSIFTDGSKIDNTVGCAFVVYEDNRMIDSKLLRLSNNATVYQAEAVAILSALEYISDSRLTGPVSINTDSRSVLMALKGYSNTNPLIRKIRDKVDSIDTEINFNWIKAHVGLEGNEKADELAKMATRRNDVDIYIKLSRKHLKQEIRKKVLSEWQSCWNNSDVGRFTYTMIKNVSSDRLYSNFAVNQFWTGHGVFPMYQRRFFGRSNRCICGDIGTVDHLAFDCKNFKDIRDSYFPRSYRGFDLPTLLRHKSCQLGLQRIVMLFLEYLMK